LLEKAGIEPRDTEPPQERQNTKSLKLIDDLFTLYRSEEGPLLGKGRIDENKTGYGIRIQIKIFSDDDPAVRVPYQ
jgi:hypothetical protein